MSINSTLPTASPFSKSKPFWNRYAGTLLGTGATLCWIGYITLATYLNPMPEKSELVRIPIRVLSVQERDPHLLVQIENGEKRTMEFPVEIVALRPKAFNGLDDSLKKQLPGCIGQVSGRPIRYVLGDRFQIWQLRCGDVNLSYEQIAQYRQGHISDENELTFYYFLFTLFVMCPLFYLAEKRRK